MIGYFKISAIGTAHLENPDGVCQDYSDVLKLDNGYTIAVIADGLGSASKSDIGAKVAVNSFLAYINLHIKTKKSDKFYIDLISQAYQEAYNNVMNTAEDMKIDFSEYNTARVGREPLRKLSATDRLTKPTMTALEYGLPVDALLAGMAAALKYDNAEDPQSVELQDKIKANGVKAALKEVSGITDEKILDEVVAIYEAM